MDTVEEKNRILQIRNETIRKLKDEKNQMGRVNFHKCASLETERDKALADFEKVYKINNRLNAENKKLYEKIRELKNQTENLADLVEEQAKKIILLKSSEASIIEQKDKRIHELERYNRELREKLNSKDYAFIKWNLVFFGFLFSALVIFKAVYN